MSTGRRATRRGSDPTVLEDERGRSPRAAPSVERPRGARGSYPRVRPPVEDVADIAQRLAVLLASGVPPAAAWGYLADSVLTAGGASKARGFEVTVAVVTAAAHAAVRGGDTPRAIAAAVDETAIARTSRRGRGGGASETRDAWRGLAAAVQVATESGAPLAETLRALAIMWRDLGQSQRDREAALAGPRATARTVLALPVVGILFGAGLGFDTVHVLVATPAGLACLAIGGGLMLAARMWNRALLRRAMPVDRMPGLAVGLVAVGMSGGGSVAGAVERVTGACVRFGLAPPSADAVGSVVTLAERAGVGTVELLNAEAERRRRDARSAAQESAAALGVRLMVPLAICVLPAFMLLSVVPLVMSILSSTLRGI